MGYGGRVEGHPSLPAGATLYPPWTVEQRNFKLLIAAGGLIMKSTGLDACRNTQFQSISNNFTSLSSLPAATCYPYGKSASQRLQVRSTREQRLSSEFPSEIRCVQL